MKKIKGKTKKFAPQDALSANELPTSGEPGHYARKPELVIGLVGPLGTPMQEVFAAVARQLIGFGYSSTLIRLSRIIETVEGLNSQLSSASEFERLDTRMDAGSELRRVTSHGDILARMAVTRIWQERANRNSKAQQKIGDSLELIRQPTDRTAFVLSSLKNPDEVSLLRRIYGGGFILISAYAPKDYRVASLAVRLGGAKKPNNRTAKNLALQLIERDHAEENSGDFGQRVSDVFAMADIVIDVRQRAKYEKSLNRFFSSFFSYPYHSPTPDEFGMYMAFSAALRSLDMSRQVGAAILNGAGSLLGMGHNDIPKSGGGLYWEDDNPDGRDFSIGQDFNVSFKRQIVQEIVAGLDDHNILSRNWQGNPHLLAEYLLNGKGRQIWSELLINNLLEFGRPLHAEMAAILDCASKGQSMKGATLFCTTFPCHLCSRMIIGAGIKRVVYVEPYHKSKTEMMYKDSVEIDPAELVPDKVNFTPFIGIAPQQFDKIFKWSGKRRKDDGTPQDWEPTQAPAKIKRYVDTYIEIEAMVVESVEQILSAKGLTWNPSAAGDRS